MSWVRDVLHALSGQTPTVGRRPVSKAAPPRCGDAVEQWLQRLCDGHRLVPPADDGIFYVLADYREHIYTGVPLSRDVTDDDHRMFPCRNEPCRYLVTAEDRYCCSVCQEHVEHGWPVPEGGPMAHSPFCSARTTTEEPSW